MAAGEQVSRGWQGWQERVRRWGAHLEPSWNPISSRKHPLASFLHPETKYLRRSSPNNTSPEASTVIGFERKFDPRTCVLLWFPVQISVLFFLKNIYAKNTQIRRKIFIIRTLHYFILVLKRKFNPLAFLLQHRVIWPNSEVEFSVTPFSLLFLMHPNFKLNKTNFSNYLLSQFRSFILLPLKHIN